MSGRFGLHSLITLSASLITMRSWILILMHLSMVFADCFYEDIREQEGCCCAVFHDITCKKITGWKVIPMLRRNLVECNGKCFDFQQEHFPTLYTAQARTA